MTRTDPRRPDPEPTPPARRAPADRPADPPPRPRPNPWPSRLIPAGTFLVGLALGGGVVGAAMSGDGSPRPSADDAGASASASPSAGSEAGADGSTVVTVPAACEEAAANLRRAYSLLRGGTGSIERFKPDRIITLLNELEDLDNETRPLLERCSQVDVSESPAPSPAPTGSTPAGDQTSTSG